MKRSRIKPISDRRRKLNVERHRRLEEKYGPSEFWECEIGPIIGTPCFGDVHGHEILSRERSGRRDENLLDLGGIKLACNHHNGWVDLHDKEANALGLSKHAWEA